MHINRIYAAFAANDADTYVAEYADAAVAVMPGAYLNGRAARRTAMRPMFAGPLTGATGTFDV